jgi:hypothetical protein
MVSFSVRRLRGLARAKVEPARHEQGDGQNGNRNLPDLAVPSRWSLCRHHHA